MSEEKKCIGNWRFHCYKCGHFVGKDGFIDVSYDPYMGAYEEGGYSLCGILFKETK